MSTYYPADFDIVRYMKGNAKAVTNKCRELCIPVPSLQHVDGKTTDEKWFNYMWDVQHLGKNPQTCRMYVERFAAHHEEE